jgi:hypothetical protein
MTDWPAVPSPILLEAHKARHQDGGADEISVTGLSGLLADDQHVLDSEVTAVALPLTSIPATATSRTFLANAFHFPSPLLEWAPTVYGAYLAASLTTKKIWLPLNFLKVGDIITAYSLVGDAIETNALTLDCKLVQVNKANPLTTTDIATGAIVQITADGNFDVAVSPAPTTVITDKQYVLEILGTTGVLDEIYVMGAEVTVTRLI